MLKFVRVGVAALFSVAAAVSFETAAVAQNEDSQQKSAKTQETFFSGNVVSFDSDKLTVTRRTVTLSWVTRTFLLNSETKIEGTLKQRARVTVKFYKTQLGDRAIHIIVR